jgi:riboflavin kinase
MSDLKIQHVITLTQLLSKGARYNFVQLTSSSLGKSVQKSQQTASKYLMELENGGFIERFMKGRRVFVRITNKGYAELVKLHSLLGSSLGTFPSSIELKGEIISGMGEGAYYMSLKGYTKQFKSKIGYVPFPGTLNVKLYQKEYVEAIQQLDDLDGQKINSFSDGKRTYGWVKCFTAKLNRTVNCQLIRLERTHYDNSIIELISKNSICKTANLKLGSKVSIKIIIPN